MVADTGNTGMDMMPPDIDQDELPVDGVPIFNERDRLLDYLGVERDSVRERGALLNNIQDNSPEVNGNVELALEQVKLNEQQLNVKESFLKKAAMFPVRHPLITTAAVAGGLYFTGGGAYLMAAAQQGIGALRDGKLKVIAEGLKTLGGATGTLPPGVDPTLGLGGTAV